MDFSKRSREIDVESVARNGREIRNANCSRFDYFRFFLPKTHFTFYILGCVGPSQLLSREEGASINAIINIKFRILHTHVSKAGSSYRPRKF